MNKNAIARVISQRSVFALAFLATLALLSPFVARKATRMPVRDLAKDFPFKRSFVDLNGGIHRLVGRKWCNGVFRFAGGTLLSELDECGDIDGTAARVVSFCRWLGARGVPYVYVQAPSKIDMPGSMLPAGLVHRGNGMADVFLADLRNAGVRVVDLRAGFTSSPQDVVRNFYVGDHHWNNDAVFKAFGVLAPEIARAAGNDPAAVAPYVSESSWDRSVWPRCFYGTKTRRVGCLFGDLDDLAVYTPRFATNMSIEIPCKGVRRSGDFRKTVMWNSGKICTRSGNGFRWDAYSLLYIGGVYGVVKHKNPGAPLKRRVLVVGDSYTRPLEAFLSTVVSDLIVLDQRRFAPGETVAGFVKSFKPDLVLQLNNPSAFGADTLSGPKMHRPVLFEYGSLE